MDRDEPRLDLSGLDATPREIAELDQVLAEVEAEEQAGRDV